MPYRPPMSLAAGFAFAVLWHSLAARAQADDEPNGRDFPKTLTLDEPGVDDEVSLPTFVHVENARLDTTPASVENDVDFEIDKRLTERLQLQLVGGYRSLADDGNDRGHGWEDFSLAAKYVVLDRPASETMITLGATREFGRTGTARVGAAGVGSTTPTVYFGQGFGAFRLPALLRPFALTGTLGYALPDRSEGARFGQVLQIDDSLQYSMHYLAPELRALGLPEATQRIVAIVELTYAVSLTRSSDDDVQQRFVAPGLIYAGDGYQLALEALLPLARTSGTGVGAIAQLNLSFGTLGLGRIARPFWVNR